MASYNEISVQSLYRLIGTPECPTILDVRIDEDFEQDPQLIPTARRHSYADVSSLKDELQNCSVIVCCQKGLKLSQGAAAVLRNLGIQAEVLEGGHLAWAQAGLPLVNVDKIPTEQDTDQHHGGYLWVTKQRPKIDRIACPWLIRRFVDPQAQFLFVANSQVLNVAERFNATPFDVEDVFYTHREEKCTFDTMLEEFGLKTPALERLATIVRAADTNQHDLAPQAAGLLAISIGLSRVYRDDLEQLDAGLLIYDSLYRWARDASEEGHDWPQHQKGK
ncbi:MAG: chromate resistance protein ChrB domain-containing protein [Nitratireductor sp.]